MYTKKDIKKLESLAKQHNIEIIAICKKCNKHWGSMEEWKIIKICDNCDTGIFIEHYTHLDDTFEAIERLTSIETSMKKEEK